MNYKQKVLQVYLTIQIFILIGLLMPANVISQTQDKKLTAREIAQQTLPSTVSIVMVNDKTDEIKSGSGFFVAEDIVVTNYHVIENTNKGVAKIVGEDKIYEVLGTVGTDEKNDLALLKLKGVKGKPLKLNNDDKTAIGDDVYAVGNPQGLEGTFSQGIVSSIRNNDKLNLLQITASISQGSSGGAVLNDKAEVIGVAVGAIEGGQSLNFAIPISLLRSLILNQNSLITLESINKNNKIQSNTKSESKQSSKIVITKPDSIPTKYKLPFNVPDIITENLFGKVKSITTSFFEPKLKFGNWTLGKPSSVIREVYTVDGYKESEEDIYKNYERETEKNNSNEPTIRMSLAIDNDYNYLEYCTVEIYIDIRMIGYYKDEYLYNYSENMIEHLVFYKSRNSDKFKLSKKSFMKFENGQTSFFDSKGNLSEKIIESYENGKVVKKRYSSEGKLECKSIEKLNGDMEIFNSNGKLVGQTVIRSQRNGTVKIIEILRLNSKNKRFELDKRITKNEEKEQIKETETHFENGKETNHSISVFDKITKLETYHSTPRRTFKWEYEFDSKRNWIKKTRLNKVSKFGKTYFELDLVIEREIAYY